MANKYFNRDEAEQLLPMIGESLGKVVQQKKKVDALDEEFARVAARIMALGGSMPASVDLAKKRTLREQSAAEIEETVKQIQDTGCVVKDLDMGLVDFPSLREGQEVYLCWKLGEERIGYYHGMDEGFAGRKPLDESPPATEPPAGPSRVH